MYHEEINALAQNATQAANLLKAMSNVNRLMILCTLIEGECSVNELNSKIPLSQSALSQHLSSLREADLVATRRDAQTIFYRLEGGNAKRVISVLKDIFCP
jgi:DNA-binding transcriptional ArsR family regulator|tara:strand:+ start:569 stop:871 length:303 start_codon:yes stop_codon:yes gene_type:complete